MHTHVPLVFALSSLLSQLRRTPHLVSVAALAAVHGTQYTYGSIAPTLYVASGASVDWAYGVAGVKYSYVVELRDTGCPYFTESCARC